ncbi:ATP-binding protein [Streptomyces thermogriseus]|uniref:ATP-binding protein n=1 Tax=Streptomyces thermogriseus TaxID=75292 RepID=A0ABN1SSZ1_9ACTN
MIPSPPLGTATSASPQGLGVPMGAGLGEAASLRRFRFELAAHPGSPAQARRLTRARLTGWSVCEDTCETAALVISELVTNAVVHTASNQIVCELQDGKDLVRIAVRDEGCAPGEPHPSPKLPEEEHGRGLLLVDALCRAWGVQEYDSGLVVWAEVPRGSASTRDASSARDASSVQGTPSAQGTSRTREDAQEVRDDLGWGARPRPGRSRNAGGTDDKDGRDDPPAHRGVEAVWP